MKVVIAISLGLADEMEYNVLMKAIALWKNLENLLSQFINEQVVPQKAIVLITNDK